MNRIMNCILYIEISTCCEFISVLLLLLAVKSEKYDLNIPMWRSVNTRGHIPLTKHIPESKLDNEVNLSDGLFRLDRMDTRNLAEDPTSFSLVLYPSPLGRHLLDKHLLFGFLHSLTSGMNMLNRTVGNWYFTFIIFPCFYVNTHRETRARQSLTFNQLNDAEPC